MKVLLVSTNTLTQPYPTYPIGLDYVAQAVSPPHEVKCVDMNELKDAEALAAVVADYRPQVVGISIRNIDNIDDAHPEAFVGRVENLIGAVRGVSESAIVLGGSGFTILPAQFMARLDADYGVIGEGERFPLLLRALDNNEPVSDLPGIVVRGGPALLPEPLPRSIELGVLPDHDYRPFYLQRGGMLNLQTKRGCPFRCSYCTYPLIEGGRFRFVPPDAVARTARMLQDAGAKYIYLTDSTFNGSYEHSLQVALAFRKARVSIPWGGFFTPTAPPRDYYRALADAGLMHVEFGTESLSERMLSSYGKPFLVKDVLDSHQAALAAGLHVAHYLMLGGPGENEATLERTLAASDFLEKSVFFVFGSVRIYPRTPLHETALKEGQIAPDTNLLEPAFYWSRALSRETAAARLHEHAAGRLNWVIGSGPPAMQRMMARLYARGHAGPLWERLIE